MNLRSITFPGLEGKYSMPQTAEDVGAAPAGYGVGEVNLRTVTLDDLDSLRHGSGLYFVDNRNTGRELNNIQFNYAFLRVSSDNSDYNTTQELFPIASTTRLVRTTKSEIEWNEWECDNPPLLVGMEYRTTERYEGKPVYVRAGSYTFTADFGDVSTVSNIVISLGYINATKILRTELAFSASGTTDRTYTLPMAAANGGSLMVNTALHNGGLVLIANKANLAAGAVLFGTFYYVK